MVATDVDIADIVHAVVRELEPKIRVAKVILFGSYASNTQERWSDIDIAIISASLSSVPMWRRQEILAESLPSADVRLSPIGYAPEEISHPTLFLREILRTGTVVYEAPAA